MRRGRRTANSVVAQTEQRTMKVMVDVPLGWRFGFPKEIPLSVYEAGEDSIKNWILQNGYPELTWNMTNAASNVRFMVFDK